MLDARHTRKWCALRRPPLQSMYAAPSARRASRLRAPAVAATDRGPRAPERVACGGMRVARYGNPTPPTSAVRRLSPGVTAPPACRPRDGVPVKWPRAEVPGAPLRAAHPIRTPAVAATERGRRNGRAASRRLQGRVSGAPYAPAPLLGRLASGGCWRADPAVRSGPHAQDAGGAVTRDRTHGRPMIVAGPREMAEMPKRL